MAKVLQVQGGKIRVVDDRCVVGEDGSCCCEETPPETATGSCSHCATGTTAKYAQVDVSGGTAYDGTYVLKNNSDLPPLAGFSGGCWWRLGGLSFCGVSNVLIYFGVFGSLGNSPLSIQALSAAPPNDIYIYLNKTLAEPIDCGGLGGQPQYTWSTLSANSHPPGCGDATGISCLVTMGVPTP